MAERGQAGLEPFTQSLQVGLRVAALTFQGFGRGEIGELLKRLCDAFGSGGGHVRRSSWWTRSGHDRLVEVEECPLECIAGALQIVPEALQRAGYCFAAAARIPRR